MTLEPLRSTTYIRQVEETSLAVPSDNKLRSGQQRVQEQVHTINRSRSRYSKSGSGSLSPTSPQSQSVFSEFRAFKFSPATLNGSIYSRGSTSGMTGYMKSARPQQSFPPSSFHVKGNTIRRTISTSSQWEKRFVPVSPGPGGSLGSRPPARANGLKPSRSEPDLVPVSIVMQPSFSNHRSQHKRSSNGISQVLGNSSGQFVRNGSQFVKNGFSQYVTSQTPITGAPSNLCNTESKLSIPKLKSEPIGVNSEGKTVDITMKEAVEYLSSQDENYQHCGASFIQHSAFKDSSAKQEVFRLKGIPALVALLRSPSTQVQETVSAALRNLVFKDNSNKQEVQRCGGIAEALLLLKETDSSETQKQLTGLLWNLSAEDSLKPELVGSAMPVLTESIVVPFTGSAGQRANNNLDPEAFYNATACLRNLSCAKKGNRQALRNCRGLIDSLVSYVQACVAADRPDDKSVENCVCVLHNLTYQLETEAPSHFSKITALAGSPTRSCARRPSSSSVGCFSQQSSKVPQETHFDYPVIEDSNPKGLGWLFHSKTMQTYLTLLSSSQKNDTLEACVGALQNLTTNKGIVSNVMSQTIVQKLNGLQHISPLLQASNRSLQSKATGLVGNLSRNSQLHSSMARQVLPQLVGFLNSAAKNTPDSDDAMATACQTVGTLLVAEPDMGKKLVNNTFINSLNEISRNIYFPQASKAAALLLYGLWAEKNFQGFLKRQGMQKGSFVNDITTSAHKSLQVI
ncbi:hypothetical protein MATL_G00073610 [Megalops atlanticus]|uniref:Plakophilin 1 n=1 Tax=Megalops atlanticus TaxID=7932 RepID=A0A9D3TGE7_MEGAT|nr:hypothetical protein MATL_G00073610 [Megalops atlanticus]